MGPLTAVSGSSAAFAWQLSAVQVGAPVADAGMGLAYACAENPVVPWMGLGMAALHAARGGGLLLAARHAAGVQLHHRIGIVAGEALLAAGHLVGAAGGGLWSLPLLAAGTALSAVADYRYRSFYGIGRESPGPGRLRPARLGLSAADAALGLSYAAAPFPVPGVAAGAGHVALAGYHYLGGGPGDEHSRHCKGFGHALLAAGHLAGAAGAGAWALAPIVGGMIVTGLQESRD